MSFGDGLPLDPHNVFDIKGGGVKDLNKKEKGWEPAPVQDLGGGVLLVPEGNTAPLVNPQADLRTGAYKFVDPKGLNERAIQGDKDFYERTQKYWEEQNPYLALADKSVWESVRSGIEGEQDPLVNRTLAKSGFEGVDFSKLDMGVPKYPQRNRESFRQYLDLHPQKSYGGNYDLVQQIAQNNSMGLGEIDKANQESSINTARTANAAGAANSQAISGAGRAAGSAAMSAGW